MNNIQKVIDTVGNIQDPKKVYQHAFECCSYFKTLVPAVGRLPRTNGTTSQVFCLTGTIPIYFKGQRYNVPLSIFLEDQYPVFPPRVFVIPPSTMYIRPDHKHINVLGTVNCPLLDEWKAASSNLVSVCQQLSMIFGNNPPCSAGTPSPAVAARIQVLKAGLMAKHDSQKTLYSDPHHTIPDCCGPKCPMTPAQTAGHASPMQHQPTTQQVAAAKLTAMINNEALETLNAKKVKLTTLIHDRDQLAAGISHGSDEKLKLKEKIEKLKAQLSEEADNEEALKEIVDSSSTDSVDLMTIYNSPNIIVQQMNVSNANDFAIEDVLYAIYNKLGEGLIEFEDYLTILRRLTRAQFIERAMIRQAKLAIAQK